ncbi:choice-of-anchor M domain-containing protein [Streptomyces sp. NPDC048659]|uniref:choice-of-anchor M domain-containing protein n=1 Tax=Streptomyces sp. NPDC048659 TaxID=3155489 RepID=UPI00343CCA6D
MRLGHRTRTALAAAGALALAGTGATIPAHAAAETTAPPVLAPVTLTATTTGYALDLGPDRVLELGDGHRVTGADGVTRWETPAAWDTTRAGAGGEPVHWELTAAEGPGTVRVLEPGAGGADALVRFDSGDGLPDGAELPAGRRGEDRWVFDTPGTYRLTLTARIPAGASAEVRHTVRVGGADGVEGGELGPGPGAGPEAAPVPAPVPVATSDAPAPRRAARAVASAEPVAAGRSEAPAETGRRVLDDGHVDIAARLVDGRFGIQIKDGTVPGRTVWREPSSVVLRVGAAARRQIPAAAHFAFLGRAGDPVWLLDQIQRPGLLWPGWSTDNLPAGATRGDVEFRLVKAAGPGRFALYNYDGLSGATVRFNSADGVPDAFRVPPNSHAHGGWAFGAEGTYRLTVAMTATGADGTRVSDTETLTFEVGDGGPAPGGPGTTATPGAPPAPGDGTPDARPEGRTPEGAPLSRGSLAATGTGSAALLGGAALAMAAAGAAAVRTARRRSA